MRIEETRRLSPKPQHTRIEIEIPQPNTKYQIIAYEYIGTTYLEFEGKGRIPILTQALDAFCRKWVETHP